MSILLKHTKGQRLARVQFNPNQNLDIKRYKERLADLIDDTDIARESIKIHIRNQLHIKYGLPLIVDWTQEMHDELQDRLNEVDRCFNESDKYLELAIGFIVKGITA